MQDYGDGTLNLVLTAGLDFDVDQIETLGVDVYVDGTGWIHSDNVVWYTTDPTNVQVYLTFTGSLVGKVWRLVDPVSGWTIDGDELLPATGVIVEAPAAKSGDAKRPIDLRKSVFPG